MSGFDGGVFLDSLLSAAFMKGALWALALATATMVASVVIGMPIALLRAGQNATGRRLAGAYLWFFRAMPTLLLLLLVWNAMPQLFPALLGDWFTPFWAALIALSLTEAAIESEILRSGLDAADKSQLLAARTLGLSPQQVFTRIVLPQLVRVAVPATGNQYIIVVKLTTLASVISFTELLTVADQEVSRTFKFVEIYAAAALYYLVIVSVLMYLQSRLEKRLTWTSAARSGRPWPLRRDRVEA